MEQDKHVTRVIFRKWATGSVIALFPDDPGTNNPATCNSYEHVGQHGSADAQHAIAVTQPAVEMEFGDLKKELEGLGYRLKVLWRVPRNGYENRRKELDATRDRVRHSAKLGD